MISNDTNITLHINDTDANDDCLLFSLNNVKFFDLIHQKIFTYHKLFSFAISLCSYYFCLNPFVGNMIKKFF